MRAESERTVLAMVASGDYKIMINPFLVHAVGELVRKKAPLDVSMENPVAAIDTPVLLAKQAPHPYSAMLLLDYLLGPEAQGMLRDAGYFPGNLECRGFAYLEAIPAGDARLRQVPCR